MAPLVNPQPIAASETPEQTRVAVVRALMRNRWVIQSERPGEIIAQLDGRGWNIVVAVHYADQVSLSYVSSKNLDYETPDGAARIHKGYNARVRKLSDEIGLQIAMQRSTEMPAVAAPPPAIDAPH
jgi:hypothetical protein